MAPVGGRRAKEYLMISAYVPIEAEQTRVQGENHPWEMPTGGVHPGEERILAAQRELREEIGYLAGRLEWVSTYYT